MNKISNIIDDTPLLPEVRKEFYKRILLDRYDLILTPAWNAPKSLSATRK
jgi:hypothetical protein